MRYVIDDSVLEIVEGDITTEEVDAIVNAANTSLLGGGGVDGAIHRAGGPEILEACKTLGGCATGDAKITTGGRLPARFVIHTVGPVYRDGRHGESALLAACYRRSLEVALVHELATVSFPAISCGVYGYPLDEAARIAMNATVSFIQERGFPHLVRFVLFNDAVFKAFSDALQAVIAEEQRYSDTTG